MAPGMRSQFGYGKTSALTSILFPAAKPSPQPGCLNGAYAAPVLISSLAMLLIRVHIPPPDYRQNSLLMGTT